MTGAKYGKRKVLFQYVPMALAVNWRRTLAKERADNALAEERGYYPLMASCELYYVPIGSTIEHAAVLAVLASYDLIRAAGEELKHGSYHLRGLPHILKQTCSQRNWPWTFPSYQYVIQEQSLDDMLAEILLSYRGNSSLQ